MELDSACRLSRPGRDGSRRVQCAGAVADFSDRAMTFRLALRGHNPHHVDDGLHDNARSVRALTFGSFFQRRLRTPDLGRLLHAQHHPDYL